MLQRATVLFVIGLAMGGCNASRPTRSSASALPTISILAEGYVTPIEGRAFVPGTQDNGARRVASTIALIRAEHATIIADPGMIADRKILLSGLRAAGVTPTDITHVFWSHHHPDHTVNTALFPNARVVDFWGIYSGDLWEDHGDNFEIARGVRVFRTPGHTAEDATLVVDTPDETYAFTHLWWDDRMEPEIDPLAYDQDALERNRRVVLDIADWIVPGHGRSFRNPNK